MKRRNNQRENTETSSLTSLGLASSFASASDPSPLQDFYVAVKDSDSESALFVNGKFCKNPKDVTANDFFFSGLDKPRDTSNPLDSNVTQLNVDKIPGLNTLGISLARIDYAPFGLNPPHTHPRGTEILVVVEGTLEFCKDPKDVNADDFFTYGFDKVGNISKVGSAVNTANVEKIPGLNTLGISLARIDYAPYGLNPPHTHPRGTEILVVIEGTLGDYNAVAFAALSSQNAGVITIANAVFGSDPRINPDVLTKAFQVDKNIIDYLQKQFWSDNNY
ncbi:hypothetical protein FEM48_Zijuj02G0178400 [Ziziphus jujuba var. spinosa]|uniref:Cupin type-1 domain-containing protein n=1 Tax=Ziziphus jujuba var. spinosa TaxID=714518 RepID=A0A978VX39_ZIZJJ|nr:hypothetical protein FEM48_Zijuj02G0178400 [Ziziphus jujuba var. spinosa]